MKKTNLKGTSTSTGGAAKINRAVNQLENVERLINGLPKKIYKEHKTTIKTITNDIEKITERIERELASNP